MSGRFAIISAFFLLLFPVINGYASGKKEPKLENLTVVSPTEIQITFNWAKVKNQLDNEWEIYRAEVSSGQTKAVDSAFYRRIALVPVPKSGQLHSYYVDKTVETGQSYQYRINKKNSSNTLNFQPPVYVTMGSIEFINTENKIEVANQDYDSADTFVMPHGIYTGIISFSNDAYDITTDFDRNGVESGGFVLLDSRVQTDVLLDLFNREYKLSSNSGNAVYYAIHKAMANIYKNTEDKRLPQNVDSINIVTITSGVDNSSSDPNLVDIVDLPDFYTIPRKLRLENGYTTLLPDFFGNIKTWTLMLSRQGFESNNEADIISNADKKYVSYDANEFASEIQKITDGIIQNSESTSLTAIMPSYYQGALIKIQIDPLNWITGTVSFNSDKHYLSNLKCGPNDILASFDDVEGVMEAGEYAYKFTLAKNLVPSSQLNKDIFGSVLVNDIADKNTLIRIHRNSKVELGTAIVCFVLDCDNRIKQNNIDTVKKIVTDAINRMYEKTVNTGKSTGNNDKTLSIVYYPNKKNALSNLTAFIQKEGNKFWVTKFTSNSSDFSSPETKLGFWIQVGAYDNMENAVKTLKLLTDNNYKNAVIVHSSIDS
jgi:hypothetical protein